MAIDKFFKEYRFLSNFYPCEIEWEGLTYQSSEAAYQASKTLDEDIRKEFTDLDPSESKKKGRSIDLRHDWEAVKVQVMLEIVRKKFKNDGELKRKLINTGDHELIEGNWWGDTFWGVCEGEGKNVLGKILMQVREEIRND